MVPKSTSRFSLFSVVSIILIFNPSIMVNMVLAGSMVALPVAAALVLFFVLK